MGPWGEHWDVTIYTKNASEFFVWGGFFAPFFFSYSLTIVTMIPELLPPNMCAYITYTV